MNLNDIILSFENATINQFNETLTDGIYRATLERIEMEYSETKKYYVVIWHFSIDKNGKKYHIQKRNHLNSEISVALLKNELAKIGCHTNDFKFAMGAMKQMYGQILDLEMKTNEGYQSVFIKGLANSPMTNSNGNIDQLNDILKVS